MAKSGEEKSKGLYDKWLKHFTLNIMTQSFHAFLLMFIMKMLSEVNDAALQTATQLKSNDGILAILSIVGMMAIIKFEKLIKQLFGIEDSLSGNLHASGVEAFQGFKSAGTLSREITQPFQKSRESRKTMNRLGTNLGLTRDTTNPDGTKKSGTLGKYIKGAAGGGAGAAGEPSQRAPLSSQTQEIYDKMKDAKKNGDMDLYRAHRDHAVTQMKSEKAGANNTGGGTGSNTSGGTGSNTSGGSTPKMTREQQVQEYNDSVLKNRENSKKKWLNSAGTLASLSMGLGATDTMASAIIVADTINDPINAASNRYVEHGENIVAGKSTGDTNRYDERTMTKAIKDGFAGMTANSRNSDGKLNIPKMTLNAAVSFVAAPASLTHSVLKSSKVDNVDNI